MPCRQAAHVCRQAARHALLRTSNHGHDGGPRRAELLRAQGSLLFGLQLRFVVLKSHTLSRVQSLNRNDVSRTILHRTRDTSCLVQALQTLDEALDIGS